MKRREFLKLSVFAGIALAGCSNNSKGTPVAHYLDSKVGKDINLEGQIVHVCPIEKRMIKLKLADGEIIRVINPDNSVFDTELNNKEVRVSGRLSLDKLSREEIAKNFNEKKLLCHISHKPCLDEKWVANRWKDGSAEKMLKRDNNKLLMRMKEYKVDFVRVFTITVGKLTML
ncbi:hypothetical protein [Bacteroides sp. 519]|uniref:hypothetical protein n=1 Tax=Bacteroides sp. 519 TaxID=2302937 RepID=UPI0013CF4963|nr:hypothetical protein [Bacteroides sp. 519]NDV59862.1 hypothetical protein [Bacteroides sp. 519]